MSASALRCAGSRTPPTNIVVTGLARKYTRKGELMATFFLEDLESSIEELEQRVRLPERGVGPNGS